jgi:hypothetical protein
VCDGVGDDLLAEVVLVRVLVEHVPQHLRVEDVDAHRGEVDAPRIRISSETGLSLPSSWSSGGFSWNSVIRWLSSVFRIPKPGASAATTGVTAMVISGVLLLVVRHHLPVIHRVELIARQDDHVVVRIALDVRKRLPHRVGGALVPGLRRVEVCSAASSVTKPARNRSNRYERAMWLFRLAERYCVSTKIRSSPELMQFEIGHVHEAVLARQRDRGLRAIAGEREEARSGAATHDDGNRMFHLGRWGRVRGLVISLKRRRWERVRGLVISLGRRRWERVWRGGVALAVPGLCVGAGCGGDGGAGPGVERGAGGDSVRPPVSYCGHPRPKLAGTSLWE